MNDFFKKWPIMSEKRRGKDRYMRDWLTIRTNAVFSSEIVLF